MAGSSLGALYELPAHTECTYDLSLLGGTAALVALKPHSAPSCSMLHRGQSLPVLEAHRRQVGKCSHFTESMVFRRGCLQQRICSFTQGRSLKLIFW